MRLGRAVTAVHDGFALTKSTVRSPLGGELLSRAMAASVKVLLWQMPPHNFPLPPIPLTPGDLHYISPLVRLLAHANACM